MKGTPMASNGIVRIHNKRKQGSRWICGHGLCHKGIVFWEIHSVHLPHKCKVEDRSGILLIYASQLFATKTGDTGVKGNTLRVLKTDLTQWFT